jgi:hypothetical protein
MLTSVGTYLFIRLWTLRLGLIHLTARGGTIPNYKQTDPNAYDKASDAKACVKIHQYRIQRLSQHSQLQKYWSVASLVANQ